MKFRRLVLLLLFVLLVLAWFTKPDLAAFNKFYGKEVTMEGPPIISFGDKFLYSTVDVNFYQAARINDNEPVKAVSVRKEEYLGLFGRFWKL